MNTKKPVTPLQLLIVTVIGLGIPALYWFSVDNDDSSKKTQVEAHVPTPIVNCTQETKNQAAELAKSADDFTRRWAWAVQQIDIGTAKAEGIATNFDYVESSFRYSRQKLAGLSGNCPPETTELKTIAYEFENMAQEFESFFKGNGTVGNLAVQMTRFDELSERFRNALRRVQAL